MLTPKIFQTEQDGRQHLKDKGAAIIIDEDTGQCECGETIYLYGYDENYSIVGYVAVCDNCGHK